MKKLLAIFSLAVVVCVVVASDLRISISPNGSTNDIAGVVVYYGPSSRNYTNSVNFGYTTNATISNLPPNTLMYFSARAKSYDGFEGDLGNEVSVLTSPDTLGLPSMVKDFRLATQ